MANPYPALAVGPAYSDFRPPILRLAPPPKRLAAQAGIRSGCQLGCRWRAIWVGYFPQRGPNCVEPVRM